MPPDIGLVLRQNEMGADTKCGELAFGWHVLRPKVAEIALIR